MKAPEEAMSSNSSEANADSGGVAGSVLVVKGKRTKRQRVHPPAPNASPLAPDSCSASEAASGIVTDEEDDMAADCLMLLAHGRRASFHAEHTLQESVAECIQGTSTEKFTSRRFTETATTTEGKIGYYVYECKTCNKCFPSFQALGGHRASHKKPKLALALAGTTTAGEKGEMTGDDMLQICMSSLGKQTAPADKKPKVHECSNCGAEFNSGQALGGHMRRHRPLVYNLEGGVKKERSLLSLDLNLPAPAGDELHQRSASPAPEFSLNSKPSLFLALVNGGHGELPLLN